ncbi:MAG: nuclease [Acidobacteria bacterium]|nr:MAG: nuclease [Acidobacteriota bacterium]
MQVLDGSLVLSASDLVGHLACAHLTVLERQAAEGLRKRPVRLDPALDVIQARGLEREARFLARQREAGRRIVEFPSAPHRTDRLTLDAMRSGADVIAQAALFDGRWQGRADFLLRVERASALGPWSYEPADAKLSRIVKGAAILQLCLYADQLRRLQGVAPEHIHVVTGDGRTHELRLDDYAAYFRRVRCRFEEAVAAGAPTDTYPEPVEHCRICRWWAECMDRRRADDHLSLVANITRVQMARLREAGVGNVTALGHGGMDGSAVPGLRTAALEALRAQARLQIQQYADGAVRYELIAPDAAVQARGLAGLPSPSPGDVFLDLEADPWAEEDGLEYLFGILIEEDGRPVYRPVWAHSPEEERSAFDQLIALVVERRRRWPDMHAYHYGGYESGALKRLMGRHAIREDELDTLLRGRVLVDLYSILRQGLRVSDESYSLKRVEKLYMPRREGPVTHPGFALVAYEEWLDSRAPSILQEIEAYNRDDCVSVWKLRAWLEERRVEAQARFGGPWPRPAPPSSEPSEKAAQAGVKMAERIERLRRGIPAAAEERSEEQRARWLLSTLLEWHRREDKPQWWRYFYLLERPMDELTASSDALGGLEYEGLVGEIKQSYLHRYRYDPEQEHPFNVGDEPVDPADEGRPGEVVGVDRVAGTIDLKRSRHSRRPHPRALIEAQPIPSHPLRDALGRVADHVADAGIDGPGPYRAVRELLLRRPPRVCGIVPGAPLTRAGGDIVAAARQIAVALEDSYLPVQGPPGSGKTYTGARMILSLVRQGRRVGVTAQAHKAITNMVDAIAQAAGEEGMAVRIAQKAKPEQASQAPGVEVLGADDDVAQALTSGRCAIAAGTAWLFTAALMQGLVDVLFVDEAGQMSLATAAAAASSARALVMLGDPNQLAQVTQGMHPDGAEKSALEHVIGEEATIPHEKGLFLPETWRLHPELCRYVSEAFYASRLESHPTTCGQRLGVGSRLGEGAGVLFIPVEHARRAARSPEEATLAADVTRELLSCVWRNQKGVERRLGLDDILLVAPYNVQVAELSRAVEASLRLKPRAGTVDKFQGQEGAVVLYSMATSSAEDAPRHLEFLYSRNRLNVAVSRARCFAVVLGNPRLLDVQCRTPGLMRALNAFCQLLEASAGRRP